VSNAPVHFVVKSSAFAGPFVKRYELLSAPGFSAPFSKSFQPLLFPGSFRAIAINQGTRNATVTITLSGR
jgi:hypothetical protein